MNKPIRVAVIDDGINEKIYNTPLEGANIEILNDLSVVERSNYDDFSPNHGTTCAAIINTYARNVTFISIKILNEKTEKAIKEQLIKTLYWCAENKILIVNLSLGTIDFRDFEEIKNCINAVTENGLFIIAACNNKNVFTYPACLHNVIGVRCQDLYLNDQYCINDNILSGIAHNLRKIYIIKILKFNLLNMFKSHFCKRILKDRVNIRIIFRFNQTDSLF